MESRGPPPLVFYCQFGLLGIPIEGLEYNLQLFELADDTTPSSLCLIQDISYHLYLGPLPPCRGRIPINGRPPIRPGPFGPFPYPIDIGSKPVYFGLGGREGFLVHSRLFHVPL